MKMHAVAKSLLVACASAAMLAFPAKADDLTAEAIIAKMRNAYADLSTYRDTCVSIQQYSNRSWTNSCTELMGGRNCFYITVVTAPNPYSHTNIYACDGVTRYVHSFNYNWDPLSDLSLLSSDSAAPALFFNLSWGNPVLVLQLERGEKTQREKDDTVNGIDCFVVGRRDVTTNATRQVTAWISKNDFLLRKWSQLDATAAPDQIPSGNIEFHENIVTNETLRREDYVRDVPKTMLSRRAFAKPARKP